VNAPARVQLDEPWDGHAPDEVVEVAHETASQLIGAGKARIPDVDAGPPGRPTEHRVIARSPAPNYLEATEAQLVDEIRRRQAMGVPGQDLDDSPAPHAELVARLVASDEAAISRVL
jgi:hypothetical protein